MKSLNLVVVFLALAAVSCGFDRSVPPSAKITCKADDQCPPDWRCQLTQGLCVEAKNYDDVPPEIIESSVRVRIVPGLDNQHPSPTALNADATAVVNFTVTEPLKRPPELVADPPLDCVVNSAEAIAFEYRCKVPMGMIDFEAIATLSADMIDVIGNTRKQEVPHALIQIDTKPPVVPITDMPDHVLHIRAPWGSNDSNGVALDQIKGTAGSAVGADYVLARSGGSFARGRFKVNPDDWSFGPDPLAELRTGELEVASLDEAGNVSPWAPVRYGQWIVSFGKKVPGSVAENPHRVGVVGAQGISPIRNDMRELGEESGLGRIDGMGYTVSGTATWIQAGSALPAAVGQPVLVYDSARARVVRFGGVQRHSVFTPIINKYLEIGPPLGVAETFEWAGNGWATVATQDPQSDGDPLGRTSAAAAFDPVARVMYLQGGQGPNTEGGDAGDPVQGLVLNDAWSYNGQSWSRLADGPWRTGAAGFVDSRTGDFFVAGGLGQDAGFVGTTARLRVKSWTVVDGGDLPPRAYGAVATDFETNTVWLFGGLTPNGNVSNELYRWVNGAWSQVNAPNGPVARSGAAGTWDSQRHRAIFVGGRAQNGTVLTDVWSFDGTNWLQLNWGALGGDGGLADHQIAYDIARDSVVAVSRERSWVVELALDSGWVGPIAAATPELAYQPPMNCSSGLGGCTLVQQLPFGVLRLGKYGWAPAQDMAPDASIPQKNLPTGWFGHFYSTWNEQTRELLAFDDSSTWRWRADAGWVDTGVPPPGGLYPTAGGPSSAGHFRGGALQSTASGVVFANSRDGKTYRWDGATWQPGTPLTRPGSGSAKNEMNWVGISPAPAVADVMGIQFTRRRGTAMGSYLTACSQYDGPAQLGVFWGNEGYTAYNTSDRPDICYIPDPVALYTQRWSLSGSPGTLTPLGTLLNANLGAVGAVSFDPIRGKGLATGGIVSGSDAPTMVALEFTPGAATSATPVEVGNAYGSGQPPPRVAHAAGYDPLQRALVIQGGSSDVENWGYWQSRLFQVTQSQMEDFVVKCVLTVIGVRGLFGITVSEVVYCVERQVDRIIPIADLNDTWLMSREKERPALLATFDLGSSLLPLDTSIRKVTAQVKAGGTGYGLSGNVQYFTQDGFRLKVWRAGRWETLGTALAPSTAYAPVSGEIASNQTLQQFSAAGPYVYMAVEPLGANGPDAAKLSVDYIEFKLDYEAHWASSGLK